MVGIKINMFLEETLSIFFISTINVKKKKKGELSFGGRWAPN